MDEIRERHAEAIKKFWHHYDPRGLFGAPHLIVGNQGIALWADDEVDGEHREWLGIMLCAALDNLVKEHTADRIEALEAQVREQALQILASEGQACDAHEAQLKAEAQVATVRADALREAAEVARSNVPNIPHDDPTDPAHEAEYMTAGGIMAQIEALIDTPAHDPVQEAARVLELAFQRAQVPYEIVRIFQNGRHINGLRAIAEGESK